MNKDAEKDLSENTDPNDSPDQNKVVITESEKKQTTDNIKYGRATFGGILVVYIILRFLIKLSN